MGFKKISSGVLVLLCVFALSALATVANASDYTGWDFDFTVEPSTITLGQTADLNIHLFHTGKDSRGNPYTTPVQGATVTINSDFFNSIGVTDANGNLTYTDHPDVPGNYTYTATVICDAETKARSQTLVVALTSASTPSPSPTPTPTSTPLPAPASTTISTPSLTVTPVADFSTPTPTPASTPAPTKTPSAMMTAAGTIAIIAAIGCLAMKKR